MYLVAAIRHWWLRPARQRPCLYLCSTGSLAITLGALALVSHFSETVIYRPLPYPDGQLFATLSAKSGPIPVGLSPEHITQLEARADAFNAVGGYRLGARVEFKNSGRQLPVLEATESVRGMTGLQMIAGRWPQPAELSAVMIPLAVAVEEFGSASMAVGRAVTIDGQPLQITGVIEDGHVFPPDQRRQMAWRMLGRTPDASPVFGVAVLKSRLSAPQSIRLAGDGNTTIDVAHWPTPQTAGLRNWILLLYLLVATLVGLALFTVMHVFFQETYSRRTELLVRRALGADSRHLWIDATVRAGALVVPALLLGLVAARLALLPAQRFLAEQGRWWMFQSPTLGLTALSVTTAVAVGVLVVGIAGGALATMPTAVRLFARLGPFFAGGHALLGVPLAGFLVLVPQSYLEIVRVDLGVSLAGLSTARVRNANAETMTAFVTELNSSGVDVRSAFSVGARLLQDGRSGLPVAALETVEPRLLSAAWVSPTYFDVVGMKISAGRVFGHSKEGGVILNESAATALFGEEASSTGYVTVGRERTPVLGVVSDMKHRSPFRPTEPMVFLPIEDRWDTWVLTLRSTLPVGDAEAMAARLLANIAPQSSLEDWERAESALAKAQAPQIAVSTLLALVAGITCFACMLSGLYSLLTAVHTVGSNAAIRIALGATPLRAFEQALRPVWLIWCFASSAGVSLLIGLSAAIESLLFGINRVTFLTVAVALFGITFFGLLALAIGAVRSKPHDLSVAGRLHL